MAEDEIKSKDESQIKASRMIAKFKQTSSEKLSQGTKRDQDLFELKRVMAEIKSALSLRKLPSSALISQLAALAKEYPLDPEFSNAVDKALNAIQEASSKITSTAGIAMVGSYSEQEYQALLKAEEAYFESKEAKANRIILGKINNGALIDDNDLSGNSLTTKEFTSLISDTTSVEDTLQRQEKAEFIYHDLKRLEQKQAKNTPLSHVEQQRQIKAKEYGAELVDKEILNAHFAKYNPHNEPLSEDLIARIGNQVLESKRAAQAEINQAFIGEEHKLVALVAHRPEAFHEHALNGNLDKLREHAAAAHEVHKAKEAKRVADIKAQIDGAGQEGARTTNDGASALMAARRAKKTPKIEVSNTVSIDPPLSSPPVLKSSNSRSRD